MRDTVFIFALLVAAAVLSTTGCASSSKSTRTDGDRKGGAKSEQQRQPEAPTPEELAESPCGNPNWAQLPEQHQVDGDPESSEEDRGDSESTPSDDDANRSPGAEPKEAPDDTP